MNAVATETAKKEVFRVNDMNLWYGQHHALKHINLDKREHEVTAIIGPSGCGKSTFIKTLNLMVKKVPVVKITWDMMYNGDNI